MEPNQSASPFERKRSSEQVVPTTPEKAPVMPSPEAGLQSIENRAEQLSQSSAAAVAVAGVNPVLPVPQVTPTITNQTANGPSGLPSVANDDDRIEKEWVDKAKSIIAMTHDNPHEREVQISQLQKDYMKKRYGRGTTPTGAP